MAEWLPRQLVKLMDHSTHPNPNGHAQLKNSTLSVFTAFIYIHLVFAKSFLVKSGTSIWTELQKLVIVERLRCVSDDGSRSISCIVTGLLTLFSF